MNQCNSPQSSLTLYFKKYGHVFSLIFSIIYILITIFIINLIVKYELDINKRNLQLILATCGFILPLIDLIIYTTFKDINSINDRNLAMSHVALLPFYLIVVVLLIASPFAAYSYFINY